MALVETLRVYETLMLDMIACYISNAVPNVTPQVVYAIGERKYLEYLSGKTLVNENLKLPRIALTRGDDRPDDERQSAAQIRGIDLNNETFTSQYATPIEIDYSIDFWCQHEWEMSYYRRRMMMFFWNLPPRYMLANVGSNWGRKYVELYSDVGTNTSELEPDEQLRAIRYSYPITMKANLFPLMEEKFLSIDELFFERSYRIQSIRVDFFDWDENLLCAEVIRP